MADVHERINGPVYDRNAPPEPTQDVKGFTPCRELPHDEIMRLIENHIQENLRKLSKLYELRERAKYGSNSECELALRMINFLFIA